MYYTELRTRRDNMWSHASWQNQMSAKNIMRTEFTGVHLKHFRSSRASLDLLAALHACSLDIVNTRVRRDDVRLRRPHDFRSVPHITTFTRRRRDDNILLLLSCRASCRPTVLSETVQAYSSDYVSIVYSLVAIEPGSHGYSAWPNH